MNHTTKRSLHWSLLLVAGAALYLSGCGPENLDDPAYIAQMSDSGAFSDAADKDAVPSRAMAMRHKQDQDDNDNSNGNGQMGKMAPPAAGIAGAPIGGPGAPLVTAPVVELPPVFVREPGAAETLPPVITNTQEVRPAVQRRFHEREIHRFLPSVNQHLIQNNLLIEDKFHTTVVNHPTFRNDVAVTSSVAETAEVLPTTEVTAPVAVVPGCAAVLPPIPTPGCAPYLGGGFRRFCGAPNPVFPVNGPYYR